jgi:hypothetical protein
MYPPEQSLYDEYELPLLLLVQIGDGFDVPGSFDLAASSATALTRSRRLPAATSWSRSCRRCSRALRNKARGTRLLDW